MRVAQIVPYIGDEASGPAYSVPALCEALKRNGCDVILYTLEPLPKREFEFQIKGFKRSSLPSYSFGRSPNKYYTLLNDCKNIDIIHNHSFWMASNIYAGMVAKKMKIPLINSPRGTLSKKALSISKWKKNIVSILGQNTAFKSTSCYHATASHECNDINCFMPNTPVAQIPNGIDIPKINSKTSLNFKRKKLLFLGRIHEIKGLENLINAWAKLENHFADWDLEIIGVGEKKYVDFLNTLIQENSLKRVIVGKPLYGLAKLKKYQESDLYVLPSFSENFGMTVAEALVNNTPVITTNGTPWQELNTKEAGWCIAVGVEPLIDVLNEALSKDKDELYKMGTIGRNWMINDFSWDNIAKDMIAVYKWILKTGKKPKNIKYG